MLPNHHAKRKGWGSGTMRGMPRLSMPGDMPEEVLVAIDIIGNNVRTEILRRLARQTLTAPALAGQIGVHVVSVHRHLLILEEHGLVVADLERGQRMGRGVTWRTEPDQVAELGRIWVAYGSGSDVVETD